MAQISPLNNRHRDSDASFLEYGPVSVVETFGELEAEYAAIRKACLLIDQPTRGAVRVTGDERLDFLNRMLTQELKDMATGDVRRCFWLNRKGRIVSDIRVLALDDHLLFDLDVTTVGDVIVSLNEYVFAEDIAFEDVTEQTHRLALHGPAAADVLAAAGVSEPPKPGRLAIRTIGGAEVVIDRHDRTGAPGFELAAATDAVVAVHDALVAAAEETGVRMRSGGWHAFNIARIESGVPLFNIDFGTTSLPHETGVLRDRVSFTKGCYLGQEVVARMESLGHPKQRLVALRVDSGDDGSPTAQPMSGQDICAIDNDAKPIGAVTSSTRSPMLGDAVVCFAQVKWSHTPPGTRLRIQAPAGPVEATVQPELTLWTQG